MRMSDWSSDVCSSDLFTHCRDVVAEVTNAGGFGVLGAVGLTPETLEIQLNWIDEKVKGKPYGVDLLIPQRMEGREEQISDEELRARIPPEHRKFIEDLMRRSEEHTSELQSLMRISYAVSCLKKNTKITDNQIQIV